MSREPEMTATPLTADAPVAPTPRGAAARVVDLHKVYGKGEAEVRALDGVSVDLARGEFTAIMGPSGSGKSTLMHCAAGLDAVTSGEVYVGDVDITRLKDKALTTLRRDRIGFVFQSFNLIPTLNAEENILLPLAIAGRKADPAWFDTVIQTVGPARPAQPPPQRALGWSAAAGRLRAGSREPARDRLRRRAHRQPRLDVGRRGARLPAAQRRRVRPDHRHGHPRPGRRGLHRPRGLPRGRPRGRRDARAHRRQDPRADEAPRRAPAVHPAGG